jgi:uncharacterized membrane protein YdjX (TVP38/TMEM64 family)
MGIVFILVASGAPRLLFCPIGGLAFGSWRGLLCTRIPTLAGYYALFLFVRWGGRDFVLGRWLRIGRLRGHFHGPSATLLAFTVCQVPMSGLIINFMLGMSPIRNRHFLLGTAFGILPEAIPLTLVASGTFKLASQNTPRGSRNLHRSQPFCPANLSTAIRSVRKKRSRGLTHH